MICFLIIYFSGRKVNAFRDRFAKAEKYVTICLGKHRNTYRFSIDINTDNNVYSIGFEYDYENPFNAETLGVNRMVLLNEERNILVLVDNENINKGY